MYRLIESNCVDDLDDHDGVMWKLYPHILMVYLNNNHTIDIKQQYPLVDTQVSCLYVLRLLQSLGEGWLFYLFISYTVEVNIDC